MDLAALYAFAEREALSRLCDVLDEVSAGDASPTGRTY